MSRYSFITDALFGAVYGLRIDQINYVKSNLYLHNSYFGYIMHDVIHVEECGFSVSLSDPDVVNKILKVVRLLDSSQLLVVSLLDLLREWWPTITVRVSEPHVEFVTDRCWVCSFYPPLTVHCSCFDVANDVMFSSFLRIDDPSFVEKLGKYYEVWNDWYRMRTAEGY